MLRIHFTESDLARVRVAAGPDPLWEIAASLHRLQSRRGRSGHGGWYHDTRMRLHDAGLERTVRQLLLPLYPRADYFPDFLTPPGDWASLAAGLDALLAVPPDRVRAEVAELFRARGIPAHLHLLPALEDRRTLAEALRRYHQVAIAPHQDRIRARIDAERALRARALLDGGVEGLLRSLAPAMVWDPPVLAVPVYPVRRDLLLRGRGLRFVPSYFCDGTPVALADDELEPTLVYGVRVALPGTRPPEAGPLATLLGRTRAAVLSAAAHGATTGELARAAGVSSPSASQHATALREAGLLVTERLGASVLHTLTPTGAALLHAPGALR